MSPAWELLLLRVPALQRSLLCAGRGGGHLHVRPVQEGWERAAW